MQWDNKGFSLIELMIAIVVLSIGLLGAAGMQATAIRGNFHGKTISQATALAQDVIERMHNTDYAEVDDTNFPPMENKVDGSNFDRSILIEDDVPLNQLKRVTVTVSWSHLRRHQVVLRTIVSNEG